MVRSGVFALCGVLVWQSAVFSQSPPARGDADELRQQLLDLVRSKSAGLSSGELRRLMAAIDDADLKLPPAAKEVLDSLRKQEEALLLPAYRKILAQRRKAVADLNEIQAAVLKSGKLDEALAVRNAIRGLTQVDVTVLPDPGSPRGYIGRYRTLYFRVTGATNGSVWGTGIYTADSHLGTAAVHAGVLRNGQTGVVKVTMLPPQSSYTGSTRNGVASRSYGTFAGSYRVQSLGALEREMLAAKKPK
jgi:LCCL domain